MYGLFKISALNVLWGMMSGIRYARDNEELQALIRDLDRFVRYGIRSGRISDIFPILKRFFPRTTGFNEDMDYIRNVQSFMKVC